jgi:hypothetical protein
MIIVHDCFVCKPGNASKLAKLFKEMMVDNKEFKNIMTDMTGQYNRVVIVSEFEDLTEYEEMMKEYMDPSPEMQKKFAKMEGYTDMYMEGYREIYRVW